MKFVINPNDIEAWEIGKGARESQYLPLMAMNIWSKKGMSIISLLMCPTLSATTES